MVALLGVLLKFTDWVVPEIMVAQPVRMTAAAINNTKFFISLKVLCPVPQQLKIWN